MVPKSKSTEKDPDKIFSKLCDEHSSLLLEEHQFSQTLLAWYDLNKRDFPWRRLMSNSTTTSYKLYVTLVSEAMLQQTQTTTVIPYFETWMKRWPTLYEFSNATEEDVLALWSGLGYYSRARRLFSCLKTLSLNYTTEQEFENFDFSLNILTKLPGVGFYTASAVGSMVFNRPTPSVDGNFVRVFSRIIGMRLMDEISLKMIKEATQHVSNAIIDKTRPGDFNQAIMDLANSVCHSRKTPECEICPLNSYCIAYSKERRFLSNDKLNKNCLACISQFPELDIIDFPGKLPKVTRRDEYFYTLMISASPDLYLLKRRENDGLLGNMFELPNFKIDDENASLENDFLSNYVNTLQSSEIKYCYLGKYVHLFSHLRHTYVVFGLCVDHDVLKLSTDHVLAHEKEFNKYPICTSTKKIIKRFKNSIVYKLS